MWQYLRALFSQQLSELDGSQVSEYDPSDGMETVEELKKYVRFLYASLQEKDRENLQMKKDMAEIKDNLKSANRRADEEAASRKRLFDKLERFMDEQKSESDKYKELERKFETLQGRYDLLCAAHYGGSKTCSDKYSGQKNEGINDGRDDFDGTQESLPANTLGPVGSDRDKSSSESKSDKEPSSADSHDSDNPVEDTQSWYHGPSRKGCTYVKEQVGEPIKHDCVVPDGCKIVKVYKKPRIIKTIVQRLEEHHFQKIRVEYADGTRKTITVQRKNGLFFCSPKGAKNSGIYNTFISTCLQKCRNFRDFFVDYVRAWNQGRRDFGNLVRLVYAPCA